METRPMNTVQLKSLSKKVFTFSAFPRTQVFKKSMPRLKVYNTINIAICDSSPKKTPQDILYSALFTPEKSPLKLLRERITQTSIITDGQNAKCNLQYSPDTIIFKSLLYQSLYKEESQQEVQQSLLLDSELDDKETQTMQGTTATPKRFWRPPEGQSTPIVSLFSLQDIKDDIKKIGLQVTLQTLNEYRFKIRYSPNSQLTGLQAHRVVIRLKNMFKKSPFQLFQLYQLLNDSFNAKNLRLYLMKNQIKYSASEIATLYKLISQHLQNNKVEEVLTMMLFDKRSEESLDFGLVNENQCDKIDLQSRSFWQTFRLFLKAHNYFRDNSKQSLDISSLNTFLAELF